MDSNSLNSGVYLVVGIMCLVGIANLVDFGFRTMAQNKANRAEWSRYLRWGLPAPARPDEPTDERLWHL
jgi:hypothetical protein